MSFTPYIVPTAILSESPPKDEWHATAIPADETLSLVVVEWDNPNFETEFEALPGVTHLGFPWEAVPPDVALLLASFSGNAMDATSAPTPSAGDPIPVDPPPPDSVARSLRNTGWLCARWVR